MTDATSNPGRDALPSPVAAVIAPCSSRKSLRPPTAARAMSLPSSRQAELEAAWSERLTTLETVGPARDLYSGRGFGLAHKAAEVSNAPLYVASAGLGLVASDAAVPAYGVTVSGSGPESLRPRVEGTFDPKAWWRSICDGPYATSLTAVIEARPVGVLAVALTKAYASMLGDALAYLGDSVPRLRIVGASLGSALPRALKPYLMPYDDRLDTRIPGTRADFAQRALFHFVTVVVTDAPQGDADAHGSLVREALAPLDRPDRPRRAGRSDEEIVSIIAHRHATGAPIRLHDLRREEGVACEQSRFVRLREIAIAQRST